MSNKVLVVKARNFNEYFDIKDQWVSLDKPNMDSRPELYGEVASVMNTAYAPVGGHAKYRNEEDLEREEKHSRYDMVDNDKDPYVDAAKVYSETEHGFKASLSGHDDGEGKEAAKEYNEWAYKQPGHYAEASGPMANFLNRVEAPIVTDTQDIQSILGEKPHEIRDSDRGVYTRNIGGKEYEKQIFGNPLINQGEQVTDEHMRSVRESLSEDPTKPFTLDIQTGEPMEIAFQLLKHSKVDVTGQHAAKNDPRFWEVMRHYGTQDESKVGEPFLPYSRELSEMTPQVNELLAHYGYEPYYFGGQYGNYADLGKKNYNTGHLAIFDPHTEAASFGDAAFTDNWRKLHELGHAQGLEDLNQKWGEGRRLGKIGVRTPREMLRAIDWETMALMNQNNLMNEIGLPMKPEEYNQDWNTTIGDAGFRALTGQFTTPTEEGFIPYDERISPSYAMNAITNRAGELGLDMDETLRDKRSGARIVASEPMEIAFQLLKDRQSPEAKRHKLEYDTKYESSPERVKYREGLNRERRRRGIYGAGDGKDVSHTEGGKLTLEGEHSNRARHFKDKGTLRHTN